MTITTRYFPVPGIESTAWKILKFVHNRADLNLVTSPQMKEELEANGIERVEVWRKGIDVDVFDPKLVRVWCRVDGRGGEGEGGGRRAALALPLFISPSTPHPPPPTRYRCDETRKMLSDGHPEAPLLLYGGDGRLSHPRYSNHPHRRCHHHHHHRHRHGHSQFPPRSFSRRPQVHHAPPTTPPPPRTTHTPTKFFHTMSDNEKRFAFKTTMKWAEFGDLVAMAGCHTNDEDGVTRTMALLCLTAFHDVFKMEELLPTCQNEHAPYMGYQAGEVIRDHDIALSYVLTHYEGCIPSFVGLPSEAKRAILFTQSKLQFNHGWFVQAEAPPGAMLATFKRVLTSGTSSPDDVALYFLHWLTDLSGAEATPLGGAEKFVLRFPHHVLSSFLW